MTHLFKRAAFILLASPFLRAQIAEKPSTDTNKFATDSVASSNFIVAEWIPIGGTSPERDAKLGAHFYLFPKDKTNNGQPLVHLWVICKPPLMSTLSLKSDNDVKIVETSTFWRNVTNSYVSGIKADSKAAFPFSTASVQDYCGLTAAEKAASQEPLNTKPQRDFIRQTLEKVARYLTFGAGN